MWSTGCSWWGITELGPDLGLETRARVPSKNPVVKQWFCFYFKSYNLRLWGHFLNSGCFGSPCRRAGLCSTAAMRASNHRITEWLGLKGSSQPIQSKPCHRQDHPAAHAAQGPVQPGLEYPQRWGTHSFSGLPGGVDGCSIQVS